MRKAKVPNSKPFLSYLFPILLALGLLVIVGPGLIIRITPYQTP